MPRSIAAFCVLGAFCVAWLWTFFSDPLAAQQSSDTSYLYAGEQLDATYDAAGIEAAISTPPFAETPHFRFPNHEAAWVSLAGPNWLQTGWMFHAGDFAPFSYVEWQLPNGQYRFITYSTHTWGTSKQYWVQYDNSRQQWCPVIDANLLIGYCQDLGYPPPATMQVMSEIHGDGRSAMSAGFANIMSQRRADQVWQAMQNATFRHDFPYNLTGSQPSFSTYREAVVQYDFQPADFRSWTSP